MKIPLSCLRGCLILVGGVSYRIVSVHGSEPPLTGTFQILYHGEMECFHPSPQLVWVLKEGRDLVLKLSHGWLQHGHRGAIHARAKLKRFGRGSGSNRWLRVGLDFPRIPSAKFADRVRVPWQKRRPRAQKEAEPPLDLPLLPLQAEELLLDNAEEQS